MRGRYRRTTSEEELARRYHIPIPPQRDLPISWNIAPTQDILAIRYNLESKQRTLDTLRWGLIPPDARALLNGTLLPRRRNPFGLDNVDNAAREVEARLSALYSFKIAVSLLPCALMSKVFISHTSGDDAFVARLAERFESASIQAWTDSGRILPGDDILQKIEQGLSDATHVIVVFSPLSLLSDWVREESHAAQLTAIAGNSRIIPIIYGAISPSAIPLLLRSRLYVDFRDAEQFERSFAQLLSAFAPPSLEQPQKALLEIVDFQMAIREKDTTMAIELFLANTGKRTLTTKKLNIYSREPLGFAYSRLPPTVMLPLRLSLGPRTANGIAVVGGTVGNEADDWRRPVQGRLTQAPYHIEFAIELPIYLTLGSSEEVLLRIPFESVTAGTELLEVARRFQSGTTEEDERFDGTRVMIETSDRLVSSFVTDASLIRALTPLLFGSRASSISSEMEGARGIYEMRLHDPNFLYKIAEINR